MNENFSSLPQEDRPYERCIRHGVQSLSNRDLLAVILRTGAKGRNVLELAGDLLKLVPEREGFTGIRRLSLDELSNVKGIGKVKAVQLKCLLEIARRMAREEAGEGTYFTSPSAVANYYMEDLRHRKQEHMKLLMLNTKSKLIGETDISKGTVNASLVSPRELFIEALEKNAVSIILMHNHPSGDPTPSKNDILLTRRVKDAGNMIGIELLDHIIIGNNCYISFAEQRLL